MSGVSGAVVLDGTARQGWFLVVDGVDGPGRVVAGPFADRADASWAAASSEHAGEARPVHGVRRADGGLDRRPSPQEWAWLAHLGEQLERLPDGWAAGLDEEDPLVTLVVEVTAVLCEAGIPLYDAHGAGQELGGACLTPEPAMGGIVVSWRQHDRMSVDRLHGAAADTVVQQVMNRALADVLLARGFEPEAFGETGGHVVRAVAWISG
jgi:hypothetical protein